MRKTAKKENFMSKFCTFKTDEKEIRQGVAVIPGLFLMPDGDLVDGEFCQIIEKPFSISKLESKFYKP